MSDKKNKQIIKRKSFKPLRWVCKSIFLDLKIYNDFTIVDSKLFFEKSKIFKKGNILLSRDHGGPWQNTREIDENFSLNNRYLFFFKCYN